MLTSAAANLERLGSTIRLDDQRGQCRGPDRRGDGCPADEVSAAVAALFSGHVGVLPDRKRRRRRPRAGRRGRRVTVRPRGQTAAKAATAGPAGRERPAGHSR
nr:PE family protein [Mycobacterium pseudokansasii]